MSAAGRIRDRLVHEVERSGFRAHGMHVLVDDSSAEHRWTEDIREEIHSVAKAVCVLVAGIAQDERRLSLDAPVSTYLPDVALGDGVCGAGRVGRHGAAASGHPAAAGHRLPVDAERVRR